MRISDWSSDVCSSDLNMLEALGRNCAGVDAGQLGAMCGQINSWPHPTIKKALSTLYGFASEYPGIRHAGNPQSALREMEMRDLIAVLIVLTGFSPYLRDGFASNAVYFGDRKSFGSGKSVSVLLDRGCRGIFK